MAVAGAGTTSHDRQQWRRRRWRRQPLWQWFSSWVDNAHGCRSTLRRLHHARTLGVHRNHQCVLVSTDLIMKKLFVFALLVMFARCVFGAGATVSSLNGVATNLTQYGTASNLAVPQPAGGTTNAIVIDSTGAEGSVPVSSFGGGPANQTTALVWGYPTNGGFKALNGGTSFQNGNALKQMVGVYTNTLGAWGITAGLISGGEIFLSPGGYDLTSLYPGTSQATITSFDVIIPPFGTDLVGSGRQLTTVYGWERTGAHFSSVMLCQDNTGIERMTLTTPVFVENTANANLQNNTLWPSMTNVYINDVVINCTNIDALYFFHLTNSVITVNNSVFQSTFDSFNSLPALPLMAGYNGNLGYFNNCQFIPTLTDASVTVNATGLVRAFALSDGTNSTMVIRNSDLMATNLATASGNNVDCSALEFGQPSNGESNTTVYSNT